jgi:hypothetical protein
MVIKLWLNQEAYMGWASGWNGGTRNRYKKSGREHFWKASTNNTTKKMRRQH